VVCRISDTNLAVAPAAARAGFEASSRQEEQIELNLQLRDTRRKVDEAMAMRDWLWDFDGELLVLETNFHEGRHYARSPKEFIPVVAFLQKMHEKGYVHGDIRCANIVFDKCLIDFDLGGKLKDVPTYPDGYEPSLDDGSRLGVAGELITKWHDWYALLKVLFELHQLEPPEGEAEIDRKLVGRRRYFVRKTGKSIPPMAGGDSLGDEAKIRNLAEDLITFLRQAESWTLSLSEGFYAVVTKWGGFTEQPTPPPRGTSHPATGSPQNPKL
jgi:serine/threonine protein kinase